MFVPICTAETQSEKKTCLCWGGRPYNNYLMGGGGGGGHEEQPVLEAKGFCLQTGAHLDSSPDARLTICL